MSTLNMCHQPPQTYSRLFRPWDTKIETNVINIREAKSHMAMIKTEYCATANEPMDNENIDIMNSESSHTDSEDNDCSSSNSSADSSINPIFDDCESDSPSPHTPPMSSNSDGRLSTPPLNASYTTTAQYFHETQLEHHQQQQRHQHQQFAQSAHMPHYHQHMTMFSGMTAAPSTAQTAASNSFYYAAAAAAAAANGLNIPTSALPGLAPPYSMDNYSLGLMEQEYARVMAEEAHLKALNARKQRPKKFKCPHCEVAFSNNGQLKGHIRIHTGERPFKCDAEGCGKTFTRNEELTRHKRIHTGLRPFPCPACGKKFGRRDHLKKHMKTHMPQEHPLSTSAAFFMPMYPYMYGL